jgi:beta-lactam-binding protein with PASTA domain
LKQTPSAGTMVKENAEITLVVNSGGKNVTVPDVTNKTQDEATAELKQYNLTAEMVPVADEEVEEGKIVKTDPIAGSEVKEGSAVKVYISTGPVEKKVSVPSVINKTLDDATAALESAGLTVGEIVTKDDSDKPKDTVLETDPLPGVKVDKGSAVKLTVSSGNKSVKTITVFVKLPTEVTHDIKLKAYLGNELQPEKTVNPAYNDVCQLTFQGTSGQKQLVIELDGHKYAVYDLNFDTGVPSLVESYPYQSPDTSEGQMPSGEITPTP